MPRNFEDDEPEDALASAELDEGPSSADIARFGHERAYCPDCGAEIWDAADVCPKCFAYLGGDTAARPPLQEWFRKRWILLVVILLLIVMVTSLIAS